MRRRRTYLLRGARRTSQPPLTQKLRAQPNAGCALGLGLDARVLLERRARLRDIRQIGEVFRPRHHDVEVGSGQDALTVGLRIIVIVVALETAFMLALRYGPACRRRIRLTLG